MVKDHGRYAYRAITDRADYTWPNGKRLAVYIGLNLEHFAFGEGLGAELAPGGPQPDVLNYAWRDYGNRVGAWRMRDMFDALDLPVSVIANSEGVVPQGWLSPWIAESLHTPDLLAQAGYGYSLNWCMDDQPVWMDTAGGRLLSVPYPQEVNDIPSIAARKDGAAVFADMIIDNFDEMLEQSVDQPLVMGIALHPYLVGQPYRLRHLRRALTHIAARRDDIWLTRAGDIHSYCRNQIPDLIP